jgi:MFS family permease
MRKDAFCFFFSLFLSRLADQVILFVVPLVVFKTTNSAAWAGLAFFAESLPRFLAFPVCGALCDRRSPVSLLRASQFYRAVACVAAIGLYLVFGGVHWLVVLSAVCGVLTTQGLMAREVIMPLVFKHYSYTRTLSYSQIADQSGLVLGPMVAAACLAWWPWHWVMMGVAAVFMLADAVVKVWIRLSPPVVARFEQQPGLWLQPLRTAAGHILRLAELRRIVVLAMGVNFVVGVTLATSAAMVTGEHHQTNAFYAGLQVAGAIATILVLFAIARLAIPLRVLGSASYTLIAAGGFLMALSASRWGYAAGFLLVIGFDKMFNVYMRSLRQQVIPPEDFGKTAGTLTLLNNAPQPLAGLLVGAWSGALGLPWVVFALTCAMVLFGAAALLVRRAAARAPAPRPLRCRPRRPT